MRNVVVFGVVAFLIAGAATKMADKFSGTAYTARAERPAGKSASARSALHSCAALRTSRTQRLKLWCLALKALLVAFDLPRSALHCAMAVRLAEPSWGLATAPAGRASTAARDDCRESLHTPSNA